MTRKPLTLKFDPQTVDHLGSRMYARLPNAVAELIANAYDADAHHVRIEIGEDSSVKVIDDGHGMSRADVGEKYLHIGRNRRFEENSAQTESGKRRVSGKKGLGKLALFGIGRDVTLWTTRKGDSTSTQIHMSYDKLMEAHGEYAPHEEEIPCDAEEHGTTVTLTNLKRKTKIACNELATSLARLFNYMDSDFEVSVIASNGKEYQINSDLRLASINEEFIWTFPDNFIDSDRFLLEHGVSGKIVSAEKPLTGDLRGITLYANGRLVNEAGFFGGSESSHAYSYLTGYLNVDFVDELGEDVITTDRRAIIWEDETTEKLQKTLVDLMTRIGKEWRRRRSDKKKEERNRNLGRPLDAWVESIRSDEDRKALRAVLDRITSEELDLPTEQENLLLKDIDRLAPPHAEYVWRRLHPEIKDAARSFYENRDYFHAIDEAMKRYIRITAEKAKISRNDPHKLLAESFGAEKGRLSVFAKYQRTGAFSEQTAKNVERGHQQLSLGLLAAFRNPVDHEEGAELQRTGALTYEDCLDALSLLSHLMRRLSEAEVRTTDE